MDTALERFLAAPFPPDVPLPSPELCVSYRHELAAEAQGLPGDPIRPGLFPRPRVKNARLLLALAGDVWPSRALARARAAYDPERAYHAHDAVACALVEPRLPREVKESLIRHLGSETSRTRGWRSRRKTWAIWRWAAANGLVEGP